MGNAKGAHNDPKLQLRQTIFYKVCYIDKEKRHVNAQLTRSVRSCSCARTLTSLYTPSFNNSAVLRINLNCLKQHFVESC